MASLNLLGNLPASTKSNLGAGLAIGTGTDATGGASRAGTVIGSPSAPFKPPMGQKAVTPTTNTPAPSTTLPKAQQAPLSVASPNPQTTPITSTSPNVGTQHPGDAGFVDTSNLPKNATPATGQTTVYDAFGNPQVMQNGNGSTGQTPIKNNYENASVAQNPVPTSFNGLLGAAVNQQNSPNNQAAQASIQGLQGTAQNNPATSGPAYTDYQDKIQQLKDLKSQEAAQFGSIESQPIPLEFQQGREQILARQYASQNDAAQNAVNQAQTAVGLGIQGTTAQQAGYNQAGSLALTGQGQTQGALQNAASLAQPQLGSIGQVPFSPTDQSQGQVLGSQGGGIGAAGNLLGQFQGAQALGAAPGNAGAGVINTQTQQVAGYQSALQQGKNLQSQLSDLISNFGLNPNDLNAANAGIQKIAQNVSSPQYKILQNYVNDIANTYAQVLTPPGGSATDTSRGIATSMLDATAKGTSIMQVMQSLDQAAQAKIAGVSTTGGSTGNAGGGTVQTRVGTINTSW